MNKFVWSALGWNPDQDVTEILRQYSRYFIGEASREKLRARPAGAGAQLARSAGRQHGCGVARSHSFQAMEHAAPPPVLRNWRFQQALYRAYYDAYTRQRLLL